MRRAIYAEAQRLDAEHRESNTCYCRPEPHLQRHLCAPFMQFALLRLQSRATHEALAPQVVAEQIDATLQPSGHSDRMPQKETVDSAELIFHTLNTGQLDIYAASRDFRTMLSLSCLFCEALFTNPDALRVHLHEVHHDLLQGCEHHLIMLRWILFQQEGCICNPGVGWHTAHECLPVLQSAMLFGKQDRLLLPFNFQAQALVNMLKPQLETHDMTRVASISFGSC